MHSLSRQHHLLLLQARQIRWEAEGNPRAPRLALVVEEFLHIWQMVAVPHLHLEEQVLLPFYAHFFSEVQRQHDQRICMEHEWLREKVAALQQADTEAQQASIVQEIGAVLYNHIRFEERTVFPHLQAILNESDWQALEANLSSANP